MRLRTCTLTPSFLLLRHCYFFAEEIIIVLQTIVRPYICKSAAAHVQILGLLNS